MKPKCRRRAIIGLAFWGWRVGNIALDGHNRAFQCAIGAAFVTVADCNHVRWSDDFGIPNRRLRGSSREIATQPEILDLSSPAKEVHDAMLVVAVTGAMIRVWP